VTHIKQQKYLTTSRADEVMKIFLLFYMCHSAMGFTHCYETTVFCIYKNKQSRTY